MLSPNYFISISLFLFFLFSFLCVKVFMQLALTSRRCHYCPLFYQCGPLVLASLQVHSETLCDLFNFFYSTRSGKNVYIYIYIYIYICEILLCGRCVNEVSFFVGYLTLRDTSIIYIYIMELIFIAWALKMVSSATGEVVFPVTTYCNCETVV